MKVLFDFFASVKLAIVTLCIIALTSICGTIIPQNNTFEWYVNFFSSLSFNGQAFGLDTGQKLALVTTMLDLDTMYSSWWFIALLIILSINLVVCSLKRIPLVFKIIQSDNLSVSANRLQNMKHQWQLSTVLSSRSKASQSIASTLSKYDWHPETREKESTLLFSQKAPWSRLGVYVVHLSILVIFSGAFIGEFFGYKASILLPENSQTSQVFSTDGTSSIDLGFSIRCDYFKLTYYPNGMPKDYKSGLTILEDEKEVLTTEIEVNSPLKYRGITFYQSSYESYQDFIITITNKKAEATRRFFIPFQQQTKWDKEELSFGVINAEASNNRLIRLKLWVSDTINNPVTFWTEPNLKKDISVGNKKYTISARQMFGTGLQVAKDPGVWFVYFGFALMLVGLYVSFFMSHRRIWVSVYELNGKTQVHAYGCTNKNESGFAKDFEKITAAIHDSLS